MTFKYKVGDTVKITNNAYSVFASCNQGKICKIIQLGTCFNGSKPYYMVDIDTYGAGIWEVELEPVNIISNSKVFGIVKFLEKIK